VFAPVAVDEIADITTDTLTIADRLQEAVSFQRDDGLEVGKHIPMRCPGRAR